MTRAAQEVGGDAFYAIVLAAGAARRFGGGKLLAPYRGRPLIAAALAAAAAAPVREIVVVLGAEADTLASAVQHAASGIGVRTVVAEHWMRGLSASLQAGVAALPADAGGVFVFLGDMPEIPPEVLGPLREAVLRGAAAAAPVYADRRGHPVVLGRALLHRVAEIAGDQGAGGLLRALGPALTLIPTEHPGVLFDVDRPADLNARFRIGRRR